MNLFRLITRFLRAIVIHVDSLGGSCSGIREAAEILGAICKLPEPATGAHPARPRTGPPACPNCKGQGWMPCICDLLHLCPVCCGSRVVPAIYFAAMASGPIEEVLEARSAYMRSAGRN